MKAMKENQGGAPSGPMYDSKGKGRGAPEEKSGEIGSHSSSDEELTIRVKSNVSTKEGAINYSSNALTMESGVTPRVKVTN